MAAIPLIEITQAEAPHIYGAVEEFCQKTGVANPMICKPDIAAIKNETLKQLYNNTFFAHEINGKPHLIFGDIGRYVLGGQKNLSDPISDEFKATIAHEFGHLKYNDNALKLTLMKRTPLIGALAACAGLAVYTHMKKHEPQNLSEEEKKKYHADTLESEISEAKEQHPWIGDAVLSVVKYTAAAALGLISGTIACKLLHHRIEFRADRVSAELMGSGKPLARALERFEKMHQHAVAAGASNPQIEAMRWLYYPDAQRRIERLNAM